MYIKIRKLGALQGEGDIIVNISKMAMIQELRKIVENETHVIQEQQILLYKGKQLVDDHRVMDYNINLNDVIQLIVKSPAEDSEIDKKGENMKIDNNKTNMDVESKFYEIGDLIDVRLEENGAWYEAIIVQIFTRKLNDLKNLDENDIVFKIKGAEHVLSFEGEANFSDIRPRSFYIYKTLELEKGLIVLANYNLEETKNRGYWY